MELKPDDPRAEAFVQILLEARDRIESGDVTHLCIAISECRTATEDDRSRLKDWISAAIAPYYTAEGWLDSQEIPIEQLTTRSERAAYRLRWIDHMIDYFGGKRQCT